MTRTIEAIYENGVLRPLEPIEGIAEHERLRLTLDQPSATSAGEHPLSRFVGTLSDADAREILRIIDDEFEKVDPNAWK
jgi:predicted DNA-binding antitoxin AbrB/MazE fold protein